MNEDEINAVLGSTVADMPGAVSKLNAEQLDAVRAAEVKAGNRTGALDAIDKAKAALTTGEGDKGDAGNGSDDAKGGAGEGDQGGDAKVFTQKEHDEILAAQRAKWDEDTKRQVAAAKGKAPPKAQAKAKAKPIELAEGGDGPATTALIDGGEVVFVDDEDVPIEDLPAMAFDADQFEPSGDNSVKLKKNVDFPEGLGQTEIEGAFLLDAKGKAIGRARLIAPFPIGGGRTARLGAGALMFTRE